MDSTTYPDQCPSHQGNGESIEVGPKEGKIEEGGKEENPSHEDQFILTGFHQHIPEDMDECGGENQPQGIHFHCRFHGEIFL